MTDEELNALVHTLWHGEVTLATVASSADAITTLRAQLAVAEACNRGLVRLNEATQARADRAEAALAAQIEVVDTPCYWPSCGHSAKGQCRPSIRNQPHDRTALDRYREKVLREAAVACDWGDIYGDNAVRTILALIEKPNAR